MAFNKSKFLRVIFYLSLMVCVFSFFYKNQLPIKTEVLPFLFSKPIQTPTDKGPFQIIKDGVIYKIDPLYNYEFYGLVVSHHRSFSGADYYHDMKKDYLNVEDVCVVYADNISSGVYRRAKFSSGPWRCDYRLDSAKDSPAFKDQDFLNAHVLTQDPRLVSEISQVDNGDQIYIKGYMVNYSNGYGLDRESSASQDVAGASSSKLIYLTDFQLYKKNDNIWHYIFIVSGGLAFFSIVLGLVNFLFFSKHH